MWQHYKKTRVSPVSENFSLFIGGKNTPDYHLKCLSCLFTCLHWDTFLLKSWNKIAQQNGFMLGMLKLRNKGATK